MRENETKQQWIKRLNLNARKIAEMSPALTTNTVQSWIANIKPVSTQTAQWIEETIIEFEDELMRKRYFLIQNGPIRLYTPLS